MCKWCSTINFFHIGGIPHTTLSCDKFIKKYPFFTTCRIAFLLGGELFFEFAHYTCEASSISCKDLNSITGKNAQSTNT